MLKVYKFHGAAFYDSNSELLSVFYCAIVFKGYIKNSYFKCLKSLFIPSYIIKRMTRPCHFAFITSCESTQSDKISYSLSFLIEKRLLLINRSDVIRF